MAWEESSRICLHMQLIAILSRIGVLSIISVVFIYGKYIQLGTKPKFLNPYPN